MKFMIRFNNKAENPNEYPLVDLEDEVGLDTVDYIRLKVGKRIKFSNIYNPIIKTKIIETKDIFIGDEHEDFLRDSGHFRRYNVIYINVYPTEPGILNKFFTVDYYYLNEDTEEIVIIHDFDIDYFMEWWSEKGYPTVIRG